MKSLVKCGLLMAVIGTALIFAAPQRAEARRYYSYYPAYPAYGPVYTAYYPRRAALSASAAAACGLLWCPGCLFRTGVPGLLRSGTRALLL